MNRFIIVDGLPYLYAKGKAYAVRWDSAGFTVGAEVELKSAPVKIYNELSIKAQCANHLDSIGAEPDNVPDETPAVEPDNVPDETPAVEQVEPKQEEPLDEMTLAELKDYAKEHDINLGGATKKTDVLEVIKKAVEQAGEP